MPVGILSRTDICTPDQGLHSTSGHM